MRRRKVTTDTPVKFKKVKVQTANTGSITVLHFTKRHLVIHHYFFCTNDNNNKYVFTQLEITKNNGTDYSSSVWLKQQRTQSRKRQLNVHDTHNTGSVGVKHTHLHIHTTLNWRPHASQQGRSCDFRLRNIQSENKSWGLRINSAK